MQPGSLIGFALVFILAVWGLSAMAALVLRAGAKRLREAGAAVERGAIELAVIVPAALAAALTAILMARSAWGGADHCLDHGHHAHLCLVHGSAWAEQAWVVALVALAGTTISVRLALLGGALVHGRRVIRAMDSAAPSFANSSGDLRLVESPIPFCFVAGLRRPTIYASSMCWAAMGRNQQNAVIAHERAHIAHRDLWRRLSIEVLLAAAAPLVSAIVRPRWIAATEKLRDADAALAVGSREDVAQAMIDMARLGAAGHRAFACFVAPGDVVTERVESVLAARGPGARTAACVAAVAAVATAVLVALAVATSGSVHHIVETLLG